MRRYWKVYRYACDRCGSFAEFYLEEGLEGGPEGDPIPTPQAVIDAYAKESPWPVAMPEIAPATPDGRMHLPVPFVAGGCPFCQGEPPWEMGGGVIQHVDFGADRILDPMVEGHDGCRFEYPEDPYAYHACGHPVIVKDRFTRLRP